MGAGVCAAPTPCHSARPLISAIRLEGVGGVILGIFGDFVWGFGILLGDFSVFRDYFRMRFGCFSFFFFAFFLVFI